jgi:nucleoside-diphosphate-sugar epimerase
VVTEETKPPRGTLTEYGVAKLAAEEVCKDSEVGVVTLRPTVIYGPFSARWTMLYSMRLKAGWKHLGTLGMGKCNLVHVHDVARFAIAAIKQDGVVGQAFNVNGPEVVTWNEYLERFNDHLGLPSRVSRTAGRTQIAVKSSEVLRAVGKYALLHHSAKLRWISHKSDRLKHFMEQTELALRLTTNPQELSLYGLDARYVTDKANRAFGFPPKIGIDDGLSMTVAWLNHMGEAS